MIERCFHVMGPEDAIKSFCALAEECGMEVERGRMVSLNAGPTAVMDSVILAIRDGGVAQAGAVAFVVARVMVAWLQGRADRKITITKDEKDRLVSVSAEGYSPEQLGEILEGCRDIIVVQSPVKKRANEGKG